MHKIIFNFIDTVKRTLPIIPKYTDKLISKNQ